LRHFYASHEDHQHDIIEIHYFILDARAESEYSAGERAQSNTGSEEVIAQGNQVSGEKNVCQKPEVKKKSRQWSVPGILHPVQRDSHASPMND
jgi:hypothetical protein